MGGIVNILGQWWYSKNTRATGEQQIHQGTATVNILGEWWYCKYTRAIVV